MKRIILIAILFFNLLPCIKKGHLSVDGPSAVQAQWFGEEDPDDPWGPWDPDPDPNPDPDPDPLDPVVICSRKETNSYYIGNTLVIETCYYNCTVGHEGEPPSCSYQIIPGPSDPDPDPDPDPEPDCAGVPGGSAYYDPVCGCMGGTTGIYDCTPPPENCSVGAGINAVSPNVLPGGTLNLSGSLTITGSPSINSVAFEAEYKNVWTELNDAASQQGNNVTLNGHVVRVLGDIQYRLKVNYTCNGTAADAYSTSVPTLSRYCASDLSANYAADMNADWASTVSQSTANPGTKYEYGFDVDYDGTNFNISHASTSVPCSTLVFGVVLGYYDPPNHPVNPNFGTRYSLGQFHTHPPLTFCPSQYTLAPGPSSVDTGVNHVFPRIARTYSATVSGGHSINLPTSDFIINGVSCTSY